MEERRFPDDETTPAFYLREETQDRRTMRSAVLVAIAVHAVLFAVNFPKLTHQVAEAQAREVFVVRPVPFQRSVQPHETVKPRQRSRRVPIPDPTPDAPEPLVLAEPQAPEIEAPSDLIGIDWVVPPPPVEEGPVEYRLEMERPIRISGEDPQYTEMARRVRLEGVVILRAVITREGRVRDLSVVKPLGLGLEESALSAVEKWRFEPARLHGEPIDVVYRVTVRFRLR